MPARIDVQAPRSGSRIAGQIVEHCSGRQGAMRRQRIVVRVRAGPAWADGGPPEAQPGWDEHAAFVDALVDEGRIVMGGPLSDYSGSIVILEGITLNEARALMDKDPFVRNGVFIIEDVADWTVYVDSLTKP